MLQQLERLQKDSSDLEIYALKLKKRGKLEKMNKILKKKDFIEDKMAIILASFLTNIHSMDDIDLRDEGEHLPCRGLSHITKLDMQKVARSTNRFIHIYAKN